MLKNPMLAGFVFGVTLLSSLGAEAGKADVVAAKMVQLPDGTARFDVTIRHDDQGWDHYADGFEILTPDGRVLKKRVLMHPHVNEQPFTRSLLGVVLAKDLKFVIVRAHDKVHKFGGKTQKVTVLPR